MEEPKKDSKNSNELHSGMAGLGKTRLITVDGKNWVEVWDLMPYNSDNYDDVVCLQKFQDHLDQVYCATWWDGKLFTGDYTGTVRVWA